MKGVVESWKVGVASATNSVMVVKARKVFELIWTRIWKLTLFQLASRLVVVQHIVQPL